MSNLTFILWNKTGCPFIKYKNGYYYLPKEEIAYYNTAFTIFSTLLGVYTYRFFNDDSYFPTQVQKAIKNKISGTL